MLSPNPPLGGLSVDQFMRRHWQRRPLLVRSAFPAFRTPIGTDELFALAARDDVESRLITSFAGRWRLQHGPFEPGTLPSTAKRQWTLLVQGVDTLHDAARALIERFRFVADARVDDLMISFATDGGGVGPHLDSYDVFLLQAHGTRRWRIAPPHPTAGSPKAGRCGSWRSSRTPKSGCSIPATCCTCRPTGRTKAPRSATA